MVFTYPTLTKTNFLPVVFFSTLPMPSMMIMKKKDDDDVPAAQA